MFRVAHFPVAFPHFCPKRLCENCNLSKLWEVMRLLAKTRGLARICVRPSGSRDSLLILVTLHICYIWLCFNESWPSHNQALM